jgi:thiamine biosynthesis lipoprotein
MRRPASTSWIDAGGFGKGAVLRAARDQLRKADVRAAIFNFGGQVVVMGDTALVVDVAHPRDRSTSVAQLRLYEASASTTSQSERFVEISGRRLGHVLDPRNGMPVPAWGSVTVVHSDPMLADILSTALFVMGPDEGLQWAEGQGVAALFLVPRDRLVQPRWSSPMQQLIISHPPIVER